MATFKKVSQSYIIKQALVAFRNMVRNYDAKVYNEYWFTMVDACLNHESGIGLVEEFCNPKVLDSMKNARSSAERLDFSKPLRDVFFVLWNSGQRKECKRMLNMLCRSRIQDVGRIARNDITKKRLSLIGRAFGLSKLEMAILTVAYAEKKTCFLWPCLQFPIEQPILYAMALNRSFDEVAVALSADGLLRQYGLLDEHLMFNENDYGDFMNGTDSDFPKKHRRMLELINA